MTVYLVSVHKFFNYQGIDYAMAVDTNSDMTVFKSRKKAEDAINRIVDKERETFSDPDKVGTVILENDKLSKVIKLGGSSFNTRTIVKMTTKEVQ